VARLKADTPLNRQAFYTLVRPFSTLWMAHETCNDHQQVKTVLDTGLYSSWNIYNMDEAFFNLTSSSRTRRVAANTTPIKAQASLASSSHTTLVATISYSGCAGPTLHHLSWDVSTGGMVQDKGQPKMQAVVSESGWINGFLANQWLVDCFDSYTKARANGVRRLVLLNGRNTHVQVSFLEACWGRNIVCLILLQT